jgi:hypothetical protein
MELVGNNLYVGGGPYWIFQDPGVFVITPSGEVTLWASAQPGVGHLVFHNGSLYSAGNLRSVMGKPRSSYAVFTQVPTGVEQTPLMPRGLSVTVSPNPFNADASITFTLPAAARVQVDVYDVAGRHVRRLDNGTRAVGEHRIVWDGRNDAGTPVGSGTYFTRVSAGAQKASAKLLLVR